MSRRERDQLADGTLRDRVAHAFAAADAGDEAAALVLLRGLLAEHDRVDRLEAATARVEWARGALEVGECLLAAEALAEADTLLRQLRGAL